jgi:hypothetical protein
MGTGLGRGGMDCGGADKALGADACTEAGVGAATSAVLDLSGSAVAPLLREPVVSDALSCCEPVAADALSRCEPVAAAGLVAPGARPESMEPASGVSGSAGGIDAATAAEGIGAASPVRSERTSGANGSVEIGWASRATGTGAAAGSGAGAVEAWSTRPAR